MCTAHDPDSAHTLGTHITGRLWTKLIDTSLAFAVNWSDAYSWTGILYGDSLASYTYMSMSVEAGCLLL